MGTEFYGDGRWSSLKQRISLAVDLESTAREFHALQRVRKIKTAEALLRLAMMYGPGGQSLCSAAGLAGDAGIAELSDKGVEGRLRKLGDWLAHILSALLAAERGAAVSSGAGDLELALVDGSVICAPGKGATWRLHARYDPGLGRFVDLTLTDARAGERVDRTEIGAGKTIITDRGYARVRNFQAVLAEQSDFLTRIGWRSLRLLDADGRSLDLLAILPQAEAACEHAVWIKGIARPLRLILQRLPADAAERQRRKRARKASKAGNKLDPRTTMAAGYLMLLTSLPSTTSPDQAVSLYRNRWQIEIGFKRLKTLGQIDALPTADPRLARTWLLAHLIAAVLTEDLAMQIVGFPP